MELYSLYFFLRTHVRVVCALGKKQDVYLYFCSFFSLFTTEPLWACFPSFLYIVLRQFDNCCQLFNYQLHQLFLI